MISYTVGHQKKKRDANGTKNKVSLPKIPGGSNIGSGNSLGRGGSPNGPEPVGLRNYDPKKPFTVQLEVGFDNRTFIE